MSGVPGEPLHMHIKTVFHEDDVLSPARRAEMERFYAQVDRDLGFREPAAVRPGLRNRGRGARP